jgi:hypothetical protein
MGLWSIEPLSIGCYGGDVKRVPSRVFCLTLRPCRIRLIHVTKTRGIRRETLDVNWIWSVRSVLLESIWRSGYCPRFDILYLVLSKSSLITNVLSPYPRSSSKSILHNC